MKCSLIKERKFKGSHAFKQRDLNIHQNSQLINQNCIYLQKEYPIPRGETPYCEAKRAEYQEKNFQKALYFYNLAIKENDRKCSAVKDMAGLLHSQGKTQEAIELMEMHESEFVEEREKFLNLLANLKKQQTPTGNAANKLIKISKIPKKLNNATSIKNFFNEGQKRINKVEIFIDQNYAIVWFNSHSGARKSLENFKVNYELEVRSLFQLEWLSCDGQSKGPVILSRKNILQENNQTTFKQQGGFRPIQQNSDPFTLNLGGKIQQEISKPLETRSIKQSNANSNQSRQPLLNKSNKIGFCYLFPTQSESRFFVAVDESCNKEENDSNSLYFQENPLTQFLNSDILDQIGFSSLQVDMRGNNSFSELLSYQTQGLGRTHI